MPNKKDLQIWVSLWGSKIGVLQGRSRVKTHCRVLYQKGGEQRHRIATVVPQSRKHLLEGSYAPRRKQRCVGGEGRGPHHLADA